VLCGIDDYNAAGIVSLQVKGNMWMAKTLEPSVYTESEVGSAYLSCELSVTADNLVASASQTICAKPLSDIMGLPLSRH
jgi:hypothetical protein